MKKSGKQMLRKPGVWILAVLLASLIFCVTYVNDYYHADAVVQEYVISGGTVTVTQEENIIFLDGAGTEKAIIFYPGAKVEYTAYVPMFYRLAEQGVDCFVVKMPGNLAILGKNKAETIMEQYTYESWYLAGHSLGGAMAADFVAEHAEEAEGLILLAAYPTKALNDTALSVLSVYGSEDFVLNAEKLAEGRTMMPQAYTELCIEGGNHAWFAYYGEQDGDGKAVISREQQQSQTIEAILELMK